MKKIIIILFFVSSSTFAQSDEVVGKWRLIHHTFGGKDFGTDATLIFHNDYQYTKAGVGALGNDYTETGNWSVNDNGEIMLNMETMDNESSSLKNYWVYILNDNTLTFDYVIMDSGEIERFDKEGGEIEIKYQKIE